MLLDAQGKLLPDALELALDYTAGENGSSLDPGCSVNVIAQRAAEFYIQNRNIKNAVKCAEHFTETRDKISLFKKAGLKDQVLEFLNADKNYNEMYRLFKGWELFERGAEVAEKLGDNKTYCEFLLFVVKKKLQNEQEYNEECKLKDAEILENAGKKLLSGDTKLLMQLICAKLRKDAGACFNLCKKFIDANNHFGAIEALNAAFTIKKPNLDINELGITSVLDKVSLVISIIQYAQDIIIGIETPGMLTTQLLKCRKFYQFEQSEDTYYSPPSQFYWTPNLTVLCKSQDSDGMIQFDKRVLYEEIQRHCNDMIDNWLEIKPEKVIFELMNSKEYHSLNSTFDNYSNFAETCSKYNSVQEYLHCCIKLVDIASFHFDKRKRKCSVEDKDWVYLREYGNKRISKLFSPQWNYYLPYSRNEVEMVNRSKGVCKCLSSRLKPRDEVKHDINSFLFNWRICKLTNRSLELELEVCLKEEETKWNEIKVQKETEQSKVEQNENGEAKQENTTNETKDEAHSENPKKENKHKELEKKQEKFQKHIETPGVLLVDRNSGYHHGFFTWLKCCELLENGNFLGFAEGLIKKLLFLIVKRKSIKPKIQVLDLISLLEVTCTGLFGSLQVANIIKNVSILLPESYEHTVKAFDGINSAKCTLLNSVANSATEMVHSKNMSDLSLHLLQQTLFLLLGGIGPSFNVLRHAASHHTTVINNGFERCLGLCLCLYGNLSPLMNKEDSYHAHITLYTELNLILKQSHDIPEAHPLTSCYPGLLEIVKQFNTMQDVNESFEILATIQQHYNYSMASLKFHSKDKLFTFRHMNPKEFQHKQSVMHQKDNPRQPNQSHKQPVHKKQQHHVQHSQQQSSNKPNAQRKETEQISSEQNVPMNYKAAVKQSNAKSCTENQINVLEHTKYVPNMYTEHVEPATTRHGQLDDAVSIPIVPTASLHPQESTDSFVIDSGEGVQQESIVSSLDNDKYENVHKSSDLTVPTSKQLQDFDDASVSIPQYSAPTVQENKYDDVKEYPILPHASSNDDKYSQSVKDETEISAARINAMNNVPYQSTTATFERQFSSTKHSPATPDDVTTMSTPPNARVHTAHQQTTYQQHAPPLLQYAQSQAIFAPNINQGFWQSVPAQLQSQWQNMALQAMYQQSANPFLQQQTFVPMMMPYYNQQMPFAPYMQMPMDPALFTGQHYHPMYATNTQQWHSHDTNEATQKLQSPNIGEDDLKTMFFNEDQPSNDSIVDTTIECEICKIKFYQNDDHFNSPEHQINLRYQGILDTYEPIVQNEAKLIIKSSNKLHQVQISKIKECRKKYYLVKSTIESEEAVSWKTVQGLENIGKEIVALIEALYEQQEALERHQKN